MASSLSFHRTHLLKAPAAIVAGLYVVSNALLWWLRAGDAFMGAVCTGSINALLIMVACFSAACRSRGMQVALCFAALLLFGMIPMSLELIDRLPDAPHATLLLPSFGGLACGLHAVLTLSLAGIAYVLRDKPTGKK